MFNEIDYLSELIITIGTIGIIFFQAYYWIMLIRLYKAGSMKNSLELIIASILNLWYVSPIRIIGIIISLLLFDIPILLRIIVGIFGFSIINDGYLILMFLGMILKELEEQIYFLKITYKEKLKIKNSSLKDSN